MNNDCLYACLQQKKGGGDATNAGQTELLSNSSQISYLNKK